MAFQYSVVLSDPTSSLTAEEVRGLIANARAAMDIFSRHIDGLGSIDIEIRIDPSISGANATSPYVVRKGVNAAGRDVVQLGATNELLTGSDGNGATADTIVTISPAYLRSFLWIDPDPTVRSTPIPGQRFDAVSFFLHEISHGFSFGGYKDWDSGMLSSGNTVTVYDELVVTAPGKLTTFNGPNAISVYGAPVPLSTGEGVLGQIYHHYGRTKDSSDLLNMGLMTGGNFAPGGYRLFLDRIDLAIFRDTGINALASPIADVGGARLQGFAADDVMMGGAGPDTLNGASGNNTISGGSSADIITVSSGSNYLRGDEGADSILGGSGFDDINGNMGDDVASGGAGDDWVVGGKDNDRLSGDGGNDLVYGNLGNDTCDGGDGNDIVRGGQGDDVVTAGAGADFVSGDLGSDTLSGGAGADIFNTFAETGLDRVLDFRIAEGDRVQVAPGTTYTLAQVGADTVISMTGGGQMILVGVQLSSLTPGWIFGA
ncbi:calcium-binding protein [Phenylobacterium sp.]|uniref:calcium-binding protein n=1 Tax=Phenylobacterium sp. TaxID=1871053 RepID=UPI003D2DE059